MWCFLCLQLAASLVQSPSPSSCWVATGDGPWFAKDRGSLHGWCSSRWDCHGRMDPAGTECTRQWSCRSWQKLAGSFVVNWILLAKIRSKSLFLLKPEEDTVKHLAVWCCRVSNRTLLCLTGIVLWLLVLWTRVDVRRVWSNGGMILTGENWSTGRKTLYSVGGGWMNEYGAVVEWYWQGKAKLLNYIYPVHTSH